MGGWGEDKARARDDHQRQASKPGLWDKAHEDVQKALHEDHRAAAQERLGQGLVLNPLDEEAAGKPAAECPTCARLATIAVTAIAGPRPVPPEEPKPPFADLLKTADAALAEEG